MQFHSAKHILAAGDWIELKSSTAGGTAKRVTVSVIYQ